MKRIILCADDYGQNPTISQAIVDLLGLKRLSATSCMVTTPDWPEQAKKLLPFKNQADIGLHFNLTDGRPLSDKLPAFYKLEELILKSNLRQLDKAAIIAEFRAQLDKFAQVFGQLPDFIDGHQHVHQFPVIRDAIVTVYEEALRQNNTYIRSTYKSRDLFHFNTPDYIKYLIIQLCGGISFRRCLKKLNIPHNTSFAGVYDFKQSLDYPELFPRFLDQLQDGGLLMCHPGLYSTAEFDEIATARHNEYLYLSSQKFKTTLSHRDIKIVRFKDLSSPPPTTS